MPRFKHLLNCQRQIYTQGVRCNVCVCLCLSALFILCTACRELTVDLVVPFWMAFMAILVLKTQVVYNRHAEAKLPKIKPSKQPFWGFSSSVDWCGVSISIATWSYLSATWLNSPLGYCLELVHYLVPQ